MIISQSEYSIGSNPVSKVPITFPFPNELLSSLPGCIKVYIDDVETTAWELENMKHDRLFTDSADVAFTVAQSNVTIKVTQECDGLQLLKITDDFDALQVNFWKIQQYLNQYKSAVDFDARALAIYNQKDITYENGILWMNTNKEIQIKEYFSILPAADPFNLCPYSNTFTFATYWSKTRSEVFDDTTLTSDGALTADYMRETASTGTHSLEIRDEWFNAVPFEQGGRMSVGIELAQRSGSARYVRLAYYNYDGSECAIFVDLQTGTWQEDAAAPVPSYVTVTIDTVVSSATWRIIKVENMKIGRGTGFPGLGLFMANSMTTYSYAGNTSNSINIGYCRVNVGNYLNDYVHNATTPPASSGPSFWFYNRAAYAIDFFYNRESFISGGIQQHLAAFPSNGFQQFPFPGVRTFEYFIITPTEYCHVLFFYSDTDNNEATFHYWLETYPR